MDETLPKSVGAILLSSLTIVAKIKVQEFAADHLKLVTVYKQQRSEYSERCAQYNVRYAKDRAENAKMTDTRMTERSALNQTKCDLREFKASLLESDRKCTAIRLQIGELATVNAYEERAESDKTIRQLRKDIRILETKVKGTQEQSDLAKLSLEGMYTKWADRKDHTIFLLKMALKKHDNPATHEKKAEVTAKTVLKETTTINNQNTIGVAHRKKHLKSVSRDVKRHHGVLTMQDAQGDRVAAFLREQRRREQA